MPAPRCSWLATAAALLVLALACQPASGLEPTGGAVVLRNQNGAEAHILSTGACVQRLLVPSATTGELADVLLGFDEPAFYAVSE